MQYTGRVLVGFWFDKLQLETEIREKLERKRAEGRLPHQRVQRLVQAFGHPVPLPRREPSVVLKYKQRLLLTCPEILDQTYRFEGRQGCPDEDLESKNPKRYGLLLAATVSPEEIDAGVDGIEDGCPVACTPRRQAVARSVFLLRKAADGQEKEEEEECLCFGQEFYLQLAHANECLYLRSEPPLLDGRFGPRNHNPLRLSVSRDCYAKWRAAHWNRRRRFETDRQPVPACMRLVIQHVMTGQCLAAEDLVWHRSLLGFECGASVHTYSDVHRDEGPECIWSFVPSSEDDSPDRECTNVA